MEWFWLGFWGTIGKTVAELLPVFLFLAIVVLFLIGEWVRGKFR